MTKYVLPDLTYDYAALEPHIDGRIMELHHDKHHRGYVDGANAALADELEARHKRDFTRIATIQKALAFNVSGHVLHSIFWRNLAPGRGGKPEGELAAAIDRDLRGFDVFKEQLVAAAATITGSGWSALVFEPVSRRLGITQIHDHQSEVSQGGIPLLVLDAWEHAYYLQYGNDKAKFFEAVFNLWNWEDVAVRFAFAQRLDLAIPDAAQGVPAALREDHGQQLHH